jgi:hypothetical protein
MRILSILLCLFVLSVISCSAPETAPAETQSTPRTTFIPSTLADSIAYAHGFDYWQDVQQIDFRFDIDISGETKLEREWSWFPKTDSVIRTLAGKSESIIRNTSIDVDQLKLDSEFINDSYWLLMPYYLVWSKNGYTSLTERNASSPLTEEPRTKLTIQYNDTDGYTPGDAYDLYIDSTYHLREWVFRRGGQSEETMLMDWSEYRTIENLLLPSDHRGPDVLRIHHPVVRVVTTL